MILPPQGPLPSLIPESAPFSAEQRVWLDGLFAGLLSLEGGITALSPEQAAALLPGALDLAAPGKPAAEDDDGAPWHDPTQLPNLLAWQSSRMVRLAWCRVHNGEFKQPRRSYAGVRLFASKAATAASRARFA